jgi:hypothetical protein
MTDLERIKSLLVGDSGIQTTGVSVEGLLDWVESIRVSHCSKTLEGKARFVVLGITAVPHRQTFQLTASNKVIYETTSAADIVRMYNEASLREDAYKAWCHLNGHSDKQQIAVSFRSRSDAEEVARYLSWGHSKAFVYHHEREVGLYLNGACEVRASEEAVFVSPLSNCN